MKKLTHLLLVLLPVLFFNCSPSAYDVGTGMIENGKFTEALSFFDSQLANNPNDFDMLLGKGIAQYKLKDYDNAVNTLQTSYKLSNQSEPLFYLGLVSEEKENYDQAIEYYKKYLNSGATSSKTTSLISGRITIISQKKIEKEVKLAIENEANMVAQPEDANTIAVLYFQNLGGKDLDPLQKGLAEMMITDLSKVKSLKVVERIKLQKLLDEIKLSSSTAIDQSTAPRLGKLMQAGSLVKGTLINLNDKTFRIDAGNIKVADGSYAKTTEIDGTLEEYFKVEKQLVFNVIENMGIKLTQEEREAIQEIPTESYLAFTTWSKGLDLEDRGMINEAQELYMNAVELDPGFKNANDDLKNIENVKSANVDAEVIENSVKNDVAFDQTTTMDRLIESNLNLTGETITGKDDRNPNAGAGFGRSAKVELEIIIPNQQIPR